MCGFSRHSKTPFGIKIYVLAPDGAFLRFTGYIFVTGMTVVCGNCSFAA